MAGRLHASLAPLLALTVSASFDFEGLLHAHRDGVRDLHASAQSRVESSAPCGRAPHWDRASVDRQPACAACLASASPLERGGLGSLVALPQQRTSPALHRSGPPPTAARVGCRSGRAPPLPALPA